MLGDHEMPEVKTLLQLLCSMVMIPPYILCWFFNGFCIIAFEYKCNDIKTNFYIWGIDLHTVELVCHCWAWRPKLWQVILRVTSTRCIGVYAHIVTYVCTESCLQTFSWTAEVCVDKCSQHRHSRVFAKTLQITDVRYLIVSLSVPHVKCLNSYNSSFI